MAYLLEPEVVSRVGGQPTWLELTDDKKVGTPDAEVKKRILDDTDALADSYFRRAALPVPISAAQLAQVRSVLLDIANYIAKTRADRIPSRDDREKYARALEYLEMISNREVVLDTSGVPAEQFKVESSVQLFTRKTLEGF